MIFYLFIISILLILIFYSIIKNLHSSNEKSFKIYTEYFDNKNGNKNDKNKKCDNNFFDKNSFCQLNVNKNKCECKFQKDDVKSAFNSPQICCNEKCNEIPPSECIENDEFKPLPYYCNIGGKCKKYEGVIVSSHISANNCGTEPLNNQLLLPYSTKEECEKTIDICDKYNNPENTENQNREQCLKNTACGFCKNEFGKGKCISGNPSGPNDLERYYYCLPQKVNAQNTYEYGNRAEYII
jgi:hypothetical protein